MHEDNPSLLRIEADRLAADGKPAEAALLYRQLVEENPGDDSNRLCLAWALYDSGKRPEAIEVFEDLFRRELTRGLVAGFALDELVKIYREEGNRAALLSVCRRAAEAQPDDPAILQTVGETFLQAGAPLEAVDLFKKLTVLYPDAPELWEALGRALIAGGDIPGGEAAYRRAALADPPATAIYLDRLACALTRAGYPENAVIFWRECENLEPDQPAWTMSLGEGLADIGKYDDAFAAVARAAALRPVDAGEYWRRLGDRLSEKGEAASAERSYERAVAAEPQNARRLLRLALSFASQGKNEQAAALLERVKRGGATHDERGMTSPGRLP